MAPQKKDFIGFILDAEESKDALSLTQGFLKQPDATKLHEFFVEKGYTEISENNCKDIIKCREGVKDFIHPEAMGKCPGNMRAY